MKKAIGMAVIAGLLALSAAGMANAQAAQPPKPGPEIQKMAQFVGSWKFEGEDKASPFGPPGKFSGSDTCEWLAGGFQVVCRSEGTGPMGKSTGMELMAYDPEEKVYTSFEVSSLGYSVFSKSTVTGTTWNGVWEGKMNGKPAKVRSTMVQVSPTAFTFKAEAAFAGGPWALISEGKMSKIK